MTKDTTTNTDPAPASAPAPPPPPPPDPDAVTTRLRAAGCVFAEEEADLLIGATTDPALLDDFINRRCAGEPLEHIIGWAEFCGLRIAVGPGTFVPRRRSEFLVQTALVTVLDADPIPPAITILDLCCGVAPFATALATRLSAAGHHLEIHAADLDPTQLAYARRNLAPFADRAHVHEGDLYSALPDTLRGSVDLLVVNAPYVPTSAIATLPAEARAHEPRASLDGGADGLDLHRRIAAGAPEWLAPAGHVLIETSQEQAATTLAAFRAAGLAARIVEDEDLDATVVIGEHL
ncbi:putative protein N(5)-glutamine methyltransferase [Catenulispora yoronensis]|uniref:Methyltransferase domain-containing protein n=1 Tax=Catenulispora yoronensis TaxID=450799 RepID=A0ABP5GJB3_9ACTN